MSIDFQKAFDLLNHCFLLAVLSKYGFGEDFIDWVNILLKDSESCVINEGHTTNTFHFKQALDKVILSLPISSFLR